MSTYNDKINNLKLELQSATTRNLINEKMENSLRNLERSLTENISLIRSECDLKLEQMQDLKHQISQTKHQIAITEICNVSEKCKIEKHILNMNAHRQRFDVMFTKGMDRKLSELHNKETKEKVAEEDEIKRQSFAKILDTDEQKRHEAAAIEMECDAIERECGILRKRNKAIMLKLRGKLVEAEDTRRKLMRKKRI